MFATTLVHASVIVLVRAVARVNVRGKYFVGNRYKRRKFLAKELPFFLTS